MSVKGKPTFAPTHGKKGLAGLLLIAVICSVLSGCVNMNHQPFTNDYAVPEVLAPYKRIDTTPKTDWTASFIWDSSDGSEENVWMCFRKTVTLSDVPKSRTAFLCADSRYWLYINGETVVFEGGVKRGPTATDSYFDTVDIAPYLKPGKNVVAALVWYWGKDTSYSNTDSGKAGFLFEAGDLRSDQSWKVCRHPAYQKDAGLTQPNYRLPESNICYDAREEIGDWLSAGFDDSAWQNAKENGVGGCAPWGRLFPRGIPLLKDYGLKDYENSGAFENKTFAAERKLTLNIPYNAQCTPYLRVEADAGKKIRISTENTRLGAVHDTYITKAGEQEFEALGWFNGAHISYEIPAGVKILSLKYRETGYDAAFSGLFRCGDEALNTLWQKSLRTLYVTMRDNFMDCPDRERAQWWGDVTNEMAMTMYALDANACLLYQKGVASMLGHVDPETNVLQTVVPISRDYFELPVQQLAGVCGFWTYYLYTGDRDFLASVYDAAVNYVNLWQIGGNNLVVHRGGSWDWMDWGSREDAAAIENAWYYYALSCLRDMAGVLGKSSGDFAAKMSRIKAGYASFWTEKGYQSGDAARPDDRANALAVLSGLAEETQYDVIARVLTNRKNSSPYMEYYVLEALCRMGRYDEARSRMKQRYGAMIREDYSTLWEHWKKLMGTRNHAWSGGPLVILSKYFAGIRPTKAGYAEYVIRPQLTGPDTVECVVPSVKGYIRVTETKTDRAFLLDAALPKDATALIHVPYADGQTVRCNDAVIYQNGRFAGTDGVTFVKAEDGFAVFSVTPAADQTLRFEAAAG
ncbi:MAG: alpha-L-rhamnosidase N-terminal domain-containing protein [Clostridia bacterium]|nr:alpha-L-rhamnosidase N-terminal domain-containing protein [Clostridia bacterium]